LHELEFCRSEEPNLRLVIVDNDASSSNRYFVEGLRSVFAIPVIYGVEPVRGIASARNRAVQLAGDADFVAFIDDDEVADSHWLDELLCAQNRFKVDIVNGPVVPRFEQPPPSWVERGHFYDRRRFPTGTAVNLANTGNVLIKSSWLHLVPGPFSEELNLSGGSDTLLFMQVHRLGAKMVWSDEAIVEEFNPPSRVSANWLLRRAFRSGSGSSICERMIGASPVAMLIRVLMIAKHILGGFVLLVPTTLGRGYAGLIRSLMYISCGIGEISGLIGIRSTEYVHTHGS
jgi:glycosyltransferase involved in cell wall biosynthesis